MFESQNPEKINIKNLSFDKPEKEGKTPEELREEFRDFLAETFSIWYSNDAIKKARIPGAVNHLPELILPEYQNWQKKKEDIDPSKFGEYTLNPETIDIDWETIPPEKIKVEKLPDDWNNKPLADIAEYIIKTYGADYYIPGIECWKYIFEHPGKFPVNLEDGHRYFFFGSVLRGATGNWIVLDGGSWLMGAWHSICRVVLLEKSAVIRKQKKDFTKPTPPMPEVRKF